MGGASRVISVLAIVLNGEEHRSGGVHFSGLQITRMGQEAIGMQGALSSVN